MNLRVRPLALSPKFRAIAPDMRRAPFRTSTRTSPAKLFQRYALEPSVAPRAGFEPAT